MKKPNAILLLAEDNETDIELTRLSIEQSGIQVDVHVVRDGEQCLAFLRREGAYANAPTPQLVLLDLHMPRMGGLEVLDEIIAHPELRVHPVVVLTTSDNDSDIGEAYKRRCSGYVVKPIGFAAFATVMQAVLRYWLGLVALPSRRSREL
jgi:CheY-like chemotaxis protein